MTKRRENDFYETPAWVTRALILRVLDWDCVLDPCAGSGAILREFASVTCTETLFAIEKDPRHNDALAEVAHDVYIQDALSPGAIQNALVGWDGHFSIVMNPPFSHAEEFVTCALSAGVSRVCALLRLGFLASKRRQDLVNWHPPTSMIVLGKRPSFTDDGKTDGTEYAWFIWERGKPGMPIVSTVGGAG